MKKQAILTIQQDTPFSLCDAVTGDFSGDVIPRTPQDDPYGYVVELSNDVAIFHEAYNQHRSFRVSKGDYKIWSWSF